MEHTDVSQSKGEGDVTQGIVKRVVQIGIQVLLLAAILFISSGRLDWWAAWLYLGIFVMGVLINSAVLLRKNPELIAERAEVKEDTKGWDRVLSLLWGLLSGIGVPLVAGLDVRFGWSPPIPLAVQVLALVLVVLGTALASWALITNAFFAGTVRIQEERGHTVTSEGPYRIVRHPGYSGWILSGLALPVMLGSLWAIIPAVMAAVALAVRTAFEDRMLQAELGGYEEYSRRVHYRLLPGVW
jgi:protein-S-isoprenylcysteine O-methyltransferase Ste14